MPRAIVEDNSRLALRVRPDNKATLMRAVALEHTDMTDFILRHALEAAHCVHRLQPRATEPVGVL